MDSTASGAWIPAFCPHPSWLYPSLDITYVVHPAARDAALRAEPGMRVAVGALPVRDAFGPGDQRFARQRLGLATDRFTTAVATGSFGLGQVSALVTALLAAGPQVQVIVVCGRNEQLRARLAAHREPGRLHLLGWTDDMPAVMTAADVVVTNGGGGTALEAVASGRPVVMADPVAGHGRANATLMAEAGLALLAPSPAALTATVRGLARDPVTAVSRARANLAALAGRQREDDLAEFAALPPP